MPNSHTTNFDHTGTYTKLRSGDWGGRIRDSRDNIEVGDKVQITKRNGSTVVRTVRRIVWGDMRTTLVAFSQFRQNQPDPVDHSDDNSAEEVSEEVSTETPSQQPPQPESDDLVVSMIGACQTMPVAILRRYIDQLEALYTQRTQPEAEYVPEPEPEVKIEEPVVIVEPEPEPEPKPKPKPVIDTSNIWF